MDKSIKKRNTPTKKEGKATSLTLIRLNDGDDYDKFSDYIKDNFLPNTVTVKVRDDVTRMYFEDEEKKR